MFDCPSCKAKVSKLVIPQQGKLGCYECRDKKPRGYNVNLHQTHVWYNNGKKRLTNGKAWEIDNRTITPDGEVINRKTGRPAQY